MKKPILKVVPLVEKSHDNKTWSARQALEDLLKDDIVDRIDHLICIFVYKPKDTNGKCVRVGKQLAGVSRTEEIAYLHVALQEAMEDFKT